MAGTTGSSGVVNSYSRGPVTGSSSVGGLIGSNSESGAAVTNSFWDTTASGVATSASGTSRTTAQMQNPSTFSSWSTVTWILTNGQYPELRSK